MPLGQRIQLGTEPSPAIRRMEIVGIVGDMKQSFEAASTGGDVRARTASIRIRFLPAMYLNTALVVRTSGEPASIHVRRAVGRARDRPGAAARQHPDHGDGDGRHRRAAAAADGAARDLRQPGAWRWPRSASMASWPTRSSQRMPEIGVRMAIGASPTGRRDGRLAGRAAGVTGVGIGLVAAAFAALAAESLLFDVTRARSADVHCGPDRARGGGAAGVLHPRASRGADFAAGGAGR